MEMYRTTVRRIVQGTTTIGAPARIDLYAPTARRLGLTACAAGGFLAAAQAVGECIAVIVGRKRAFVEPVGCCPNARAGG